MLLILRHGWQPKSTKKHAGDAQVVPILYSFCRATSVPQLFSSEVCSWQAYYTRRSRRFKVGHSQRESYPRLRRERAVTLRKFNVWLAEILVDWKINNIVTVLLPQFCYNFWPCFDSLSFVSQHWFASGAGVRASSSKILRYANNSPF